MTHLQFLEFTTTHFIELLKVLAWPITIIAIVLLFKRKINHAMGRLGKIEAGASGISLSFEKKISEAKELLNKTNSTVLSKSSGSLKSSNLPYRHLKTLQHTLESKIDQYINTNSISVTSKTLNSKSEELKNAGFISLETNQLIHHLQKIIDETNEDVTQFEVNEIEQIINQIKL